MHNREEKVCLYLEYCQNGLPKRVEVTPQALQTAAKDLHPEQGEDEDEQEQ